MKEKKSKYYFSTFDLILMAMIAGIGGVINGAFMKNVIIQPFKPLFTFLGPVSWVPLSGLYVLWPIIVRLLIRKRGASTIYGLIQGLVEVSAGNDFGPLAILFAGTHGLFIDIVFAMFSEKISLLSSLLGAALANLVVNEIYFFIFGLTLSYVLYVGGLVAILSGIIFAGLLGWLIAKAIYNTGIIKVEDP